MIIGVPKEIKNHEYRVGLVPESVYELCQHDHHVYVEHNAGLGIGITDEDYIEAGANILPTPQAVFDNSKLIIKVKEPQASEIAMLKPQHCLVTYLHLAADSKQAQGLIASQATCIAYETVTDNKGGLPLLAPMSEVAGRLSIQAGAQALEKRNGGRGLLLGGVPGVSPAEVLIIGGGMVGRNAAKMALGLGAKVTLLDNNIDVLRHLNELFGSNLITLFSNKESLDKQLKKADLVIGAVLIPGATAPTLVTEEQVKTMKTGAALVDVAIDQGGCFATSKATSHDDPMYILHEVVHYCVANMPGAVARTSAFALNNVTLPYILKIANQGIEAALKADTHLFNGVNVYQGQICNEQVAQSLNLPFHKLRL